MSDFSRETTPFIYDDNSPAAINLFHEVLLTANPTKKLFAESIPQMLTSSRVDYILT